jgi:hypothetical protein
MGLATFGDCTCSQSAVMSTQNGQIHFLFSSHLLLDMTFSSHLQTFSAKAPDLLITEVNRESLLEVMMVEDVPHQSLDNHKSFRIGDVMVGVKKLTMATF